MIPQPSPGEGGSSRWPSSARKSSFAARAVRDDDQAYQDGQVWPGAVRGGGSLDLAIAEFTSCWERGEQPRLEDYLDRLRGSGGRPGDMVELIYREFCLVEEEGSAPRPEAYFERFPEHAEGLERVLGVHDLLDSSRLRLWSGCEGNAEPTPLPEVGDEVGPYRLIRLLGHGGFARVYLAEQMDLDDRLVVVKVSTRLTTEPRLLARARHPHIVEVLWHGEVEGGSLQLICMPFLGGATLSDVLARRQARGARLGTGRELLEDLDRVSAAGYLPAVSGRPARELLAGLSYAKAAAWVVARLAEALDHAYARGVLHGDVKPSNVLLAADGTPMLLDFNLSVGWRVDTTSGGRRDLPDDAGGTLAYMAPERIQAALDPDCARRPKAADRHRADIYAIGIVLLEMLTGRPPGQVGGRPQSLKEMASVKGSSRRPGVAPLIRSARAQLPAGMRTVLERCLALDPAERYARASELAEDLDRWRLDRAFTHAREPVLRSGLVRWARRRRLALISAMIGIALAASATFLTWRILDGGGQKRALAHYARLLESEASTAFLARQPGSGQITSRDDRAEVARRHLQRYGVLDTEGGDWRARENFRELPPFEQEELEAWLMEQALRYAHSLGERPDSERDWREAIFCLERFDGEDRSGPLRDKAIGLRAKLNDSSTRFGSRIDPARAEWIDAYLLGVVSELRDDAGTAAEHYADVLRDRPDSFWGNYRAAAVASAIGSRAKSDSIHKKDDILRAKAEIYFGRAARYLQVCLRRNSDLSALHRLLAGCLYGQDRLAEAQDEYDKALQLGPESAENLMARSIVSLRLSQFDGFKKAMLRFDARRGVRRGVSRDMANPGLATSLRPDEGLMGLGLGKNDREAAAHDPDEPGMRRTLGYLLTAAKENEQALRQFDIVLDQTPEDVWVRYDRAVLYQHQGRAEADLEYERVADHPSIESVVLNRPELIHSFPRAVVSLITRGEIEQGLRKAKQGVKLADLVKLQQFDTRMAQSWALTAAAKVQPSLRLEAIDTLRKVSRLYPKQFQEVYTNNRAFDDLRGEFSGYLDR